MTTPPRDPRGEPTTQVLLTILESALLKLLERGMGAAAEESIRRAMSCGCRSGASDAPAPPDPRGSATVIRLPVMLPRGSR